VPSNINRIKKTTGRRERDESGKDVTTFQNGRKGKKRAMRNLEW
jgi:hypothetical protein